MSDPESLVCHGSMNRIIDSSSNQGLEIERQTSLHKTPEQELQELQNVWNLEQILQRFENRVVNHIKANESTKQELLKFLKEI